MNKKNLVKIVIKRGKSGFLYSLPLSFNSSKFDQLLNIWRSYPWYQQPDSVKIVWPGMVYEIHQDKYNNLIYREYAQKQTSRSQARSQNVLD